MAKTIYSPANRELTALLRRLREEANLRQVEVAERLGRRQSFVSKYESGERRLDLVELSAICSVLGVSLIDFVAEFQAALARNGGS